MSQFVEWFPEMMAAWTASEGSKTRYDAARGVPKQHTNVQNRPLISITRILCDEFKSSTGSCQYGIVGQLLLVSGLEAPGGYGTIYDRVMRRYQRHRHTQ